MLTARKSEGVKKRTILEIIENYKLRMPPTVYYHLLADVRELEEEQEPKFIAKSDGTIEQIKNCEDCLYRKEWEKIGKLLSIILEKHIEQEPVLDKINKMKSEIADSLEFWDYSPNNNPLARDMLETLTNFWGDIRSEEE